MIVSPVILYEWGQLMQMLSTEAVIFILTLKIVDLKWEQHSAPPNLTSSSHLWQESGVGHFLYACSILISNFYLCYYSAKLLSQHFRALV